MGCCKSFLRKSKEQSIEVSPISVEEEGKDEAILSIDSNNAQNKTDSYYRLCDQLSNQGESPDQLGKPDTTDTSATTIKNETLMNTLINEPHGGINKLPVKNCKQKLSNRSEKVLKFQKTKVANKNRPKEVRQEMNKKRIRKGKRLRNAARPRVGTCLLVTDNRISGCVRNTGRKLTGLFMKKLLCNYQ